MLLRVCVHECVRGCVCCTESHLDFFKSLTTDFNRKLSSSKKFFLTLFIVILKLSWNKDERSNCSESSFYTLFFSLVFITILTVKIGTNG